MQVAAGADGVHLKATPVKSFGTGLSLLGKKFEDALHLKAGRGKGDDAMPNYSGGVTTVCPFYQRESKYQITCEGIICGSYTQTRFSSEAEKLEFMRKACASFEHALRCPLARLLMQRYLDSKKE